MKVVSILSSKGATVVTLRPTDTILSVIHTLTGEGIGSIVLSDDGAMIKGIISERDVVRGFAEHGPDTLELQASKLMTQRVETCSPDTTLQEVMIVMTKYRIRHLPVTEDGILCGIISIGDVVKHRLEEVEAEASALKSYVTGS